MSHEESVELTVVARHAGVRVALVRRYLEFGLIEAGIARLAENCLSPVDSAEICAEIAFV